MSEVRRLDGAKAAVDRNGVVTFSVPYLVYSEDEIFTMKPDRHPLGLPIVDRNATQEGSDWIVVIKFEGVPGNATPDEEQETYELDGTTSEDPIETHVEFANIKKKYQGDTDQGQVTWPETISVDGKSIRNPMLGVTAFLNFGCVWRRTYSSRVFPDSLILSLGLIDVPRGKQQPPRLPEDRNWIKKAVKASWRGNVWTITEEWLGSGRGGWNRDVYKGRGTGAVSAHNQPLSLTSARIS